MAKLAGVSPITVSRVFNRPEMVASGTLEHVRRVIERTGYVPNLLAGGLASRRTRFVAAIVPAISNQIFSESIQSLTDRLWESGYQVLLGTSGYPTSREESLLAAILSRRPDGIFLTGISHSSGSRRRLVAANIPIVEVWDLTPTPVDMLVGFSHEKVGQAVAEYLVGRGHRHFGVISADDARAEVRRMGFLSVLEKNRIDDVQTVHVPAPSNFRLGREGLARLLERGSLPRAVFCSSDTLAHGVLIEALARGLSVPGDLAIVGFADLDFAAHTFPPLSTVRIDRPAIGRRAAEALLERIEGRPVERIVDIGFHVMERGTT
ncbi:MAG: Transcriptional regulator, LacI family [Deltaproteobacteria bacterium]|nr:Transcriptional regulator, LacI family [Deltaproteobacteria bacterium]MBS1244356.1 Transcriptional regulator, LacI family [Deltaproteobacteria bacterium]